ncbi:MAG: lysophospholipid acyltransferase family protein [Myxococcota bacterium]
MVLPVSDEILARVDRLGLPFNRHGVDPYGLRRKSLARTYTFMSWMYRNYFDVHVFGLEHVPDRGRGMIVGNHSGGIALDAAMTSTAVLLEKDPPRLGQGMAEKFISKVPMMGTWAQQSGALTGTPENAVHLLENERLLMVYPEGARGTEKLYPDRHRLVDFGTGFLRLALRTGTPIVPVAFVGGGDAIPTVVNLYGVARRFGVPYIPITPWLVTWPRPTTLQIYFGEPLTFDGEGNEEDIVIHRWVETVKESIRVLLERGVKERASLDKKRGSSRLGQLLGEDQ